MHRYPEKHLRQPPKSPKLGGLSDSGGHPQSPRQKEFWISFWREGFNLDSDGGECFAIRLFIIGYDNCYDRINSIELS